MNKFVCAEWWTKNYMICRVLSWAAPCALKNTGTAPLDPFILSLKRHKLILWRFEDKMIKK